MSANFESGRIHSASHDIQEDVPSPTTDNQQEDSVVPQVSTGVVPPGIISWSCRKIVQDLYMQWMIQNQEIVYAHLWISIKVLLKCCI